MSQGGVTLGLLLVLQEAFPEIGEGVVALGMAVIIGNILGGPILLKTALSRAEAATPGMTGGAPEGAPKGAQTGRAVEAGTGRKAEVTGEAEGA